MHTIPQNVTSYEDKIVGQFVGRQFIYLAIGGVVAFLLLTTQLGPLFIRFFLAVVVGMFAAAMALLKIQDRGFDIWVFAFLRAVLGPTEWTWRKQAVPASVLLPDGATEAPPPAQAAVVKPEVPKLAPREKIDQFESYLSKAKNDLDDQEQDFLKNLDYSALPPDSLYAQQQPAYAGMLTPDHPQPQPLQPPPSPLPSPAAGIGLAQSTEDKQMSFAVDGKQESVNLHQNQEVGRALSSQVLSGGMLPLPVHGELHLSLSRDLKDDFSHLVGFAPTQEIKAEPLGSLTPAVVASPPPAEPPKPTQLGSTFQIPHQPLQIITDPGPAAGPSQAEIEQQKAGEAEAARQAQEALAQAEAERQRRETERRQAEERARQEALAKAQAEEEQRRQDAARQELERQRLEAEQLVEEERQAEVARQEQERLAEEQRQQAAEELRRLEEQRLAEIEAEMRAKAQEEIERVRAEAEAKTQAAVAAEEAKAQAKLAEEEQAREAQIQAVAGKYEEELSKLAEHTAEVEKRSEQAADQLRKMEEQVEQLTLQGQGQAAEESAPAAESQEESAPSAGSETAEAAESQGMGIATEPELNVIAESEPQPAEEAIAPLMASGEGDTGEPQQGMETSGNESMIDSGASPLQSAGSESLTELSGPALPEAPVQAMTPDVTTVSLGNEPMMDLPASPSFEGEKINNERIFPTSERIKQLAAEVKNTPKPKVVEATILNDQNMLALTTQPNVINGVVFDRAGQFLPGVVVVIKDNQNEPKRALKTNKLGQFVITTPLPNGSYSVAVERKGVTFDVVKVELTGGVMPPLKIQGY